MGTLASELRSIAANLSETPRVYVDANFPIGVVAYMRQVLHWDVFFVLEDPAIRRAPDTEHFRRALELTRTLITLDHDFLDDRRFLPALSSGVIVCSAPGEAALKRLLAKLDRDVLRTDPVVDLPLRGQKIVAG